MRHFKTKKEALKFRDEQRKFGHDSLRIFKKRKGQSNRINKPFMVGTELDWLNWG